MPVSVPTFIKQAWAAVGSKFTIPDNANPTTGRAGWDQGFSPINLTPVAAGGIPPFGQDMNGVLHDLSQAIKYVQSGVESPFNQDFATAIGGYEIGAIVSDASDKSLLWVNGTANNTVFPSGWTSFKRSDPTETVRGLPLVATQAETNAGTDDARIVTPKKLRAGFSFDFSDPDGCWIAFPTWLGGLIIQMGRGPAFSGTQTISMPISFPNTFLQAFACYDLPSANTYPTIAITNSGNSQITVGQKGPTGPLRLRWIAFGN